MELMVLIFVVYIWNDQPSPLKSKIKYRSNTFTLESLF